MNGISIPKLALSDIRALARNHDFVKLWAGMFMAQSAVNMLHFVLIIHLFQQTRSSFFVGSLIATLSLAPLLFSSLAGVLSDSRDRRSIITTVNLLRAVLTALIFITLPWPGLTLILAFLITVVVQFLPPAETASIPELVPKDKLVTANAAYTLTFYASFLIGYTAGGPLLEYLGSVQTLIIIFVLFSIATLIDLSLPKLREHLHKAHDNIELGVRVVWGRFKEGINFVKARPGITLVFLQVATIFAIERGIIALAPAMAENLFNLSVAEISLIFVSPLAIGTVVGVLIVNHFKKTHSRGQLIRLGLLLDAISLLMFPLFFWVGFSPDMSLLTRLYIGSLTFLSGLADVLIIVSAQTYLQEAAPAHTRGRVFGSLIAVMNIIGIPVILLMAWVESLVTAATILAFSGLAVALLYIFSVTLRQVTDRAPSHPK